MSSTVIRAQALSKSYQIAHAGRGYKTLQEDVIALIKRPLKRGAAVPRRETFWALRDISFDVKHGEVLGIIGRNGAGKSTLLKILSRITKPTSGRADIYGRIGSLLEVGTGFHPELTGRENIFLNGAILGMTRRDIAKHFDEIVSFAEIDQFLETPVKRYSSGMYMRLAFAVAAHLEPEVLVIDEVLAVGDAKFQEKSLGKMGDVAKSGRTVLFVSHNMAAVQQLCSNAILLEHGQISYQGSTNETINHYLSTETIGENDMRDRQDRSGAGNLRFTHVEFFDKNGQKLHHVLSGQTVKLRFYYVSSKTLTDATVHLAFNVYNPLGLILTNLNTRDVGSTTQSIGRDGYFECTWERFNLRSAVYTCALYCEVNGIVEDWIQSAFQLHVDDGDYHGTGSLIDRGQGDILVSYEWRGMITGNAS
ncbi:MAG: ABC transporter ATP-binding protein [Anaerolineae bacterium]